MLDVNVLLIEKEKKKEELFDYSFPSLRDFSESLSIGVE
jgi:hypothetical protein